MSKKVFLKWNVLYFNILLKKIIQNSIFYYENNNTFASLFEEAFFFFEKISKFYLNLHICQL